MGYKMPSVTVASWTFPLLVHTSVCFAQDQLIKIPQLPPSALSNQPQVDSRVKFGKGLSQLGYDEGFSRQVDKAIRSAVQDATPSIRFTGRGALLKVEVLSAHDGGGGRWLRLRGDRVDVLSLGRSAHDALFLYTSNPNFVSAIPSGYRVDEKLSSYIWVDEKNGEIRFRWILGGLRPLHDAIAEKISDDLTKRGRDSLRDLDVYSVMTKKAANDQKQPSDLARRAMEQIAAAEKTIERVERDLNSALERERKLADEASRLRDATKLVNFALALNSARASMKGDAEGTEQLGKAKTKGELRIIVRSRMEYWSGKTEAHYSQYIEAYEKFDQAFSNAEKSAPLTPLVRDYLNATRPIRSIPKPTHINPLP